MRQHNLMHRIQNWNNAGRLQPFARNNRSNRPHIGISLTFGYQPAPITTYSPTPVVTYQPVPVMSYQRARACHVLTARGFVNVCSY